MVIYTIDQNTGLPIYDEEKAIEQSILNIITTPIGSRVMRRNFGSGAFHLMDQPISSVLFMRLQASIAQALLKFEPRVRFTSIKVKQKKEHIEVDMEGFRVGTNKSLKFSNIKINT